MKRMKSTLLLLCLSGWVLSGAAWANPGRGHGHGHGGARIGFSVGAPLYWPSYYPQYPQPYYPYYSPYAPPYSYSYSPPVYIEQGQQYWYFCSNPQGYHPYVKQCPGGWQQVIPPAGN